MKAELGKIETTRYFAAGQTRARAAVHTDEERFSVLAIREGVGRFCLFRKPVSVELVWRGYKEPRNEEERRQLPSVIDRREVKARTMERAVNTALEEFFPEDK